MPLLITMAVYRGKTDADCVYALLNRQVIILLTHMERSSGYSVNHRLVHRLWSVGTGLSDWAPGANHVPALTAEVYGLHAPRPL